MKFAAQSVSCHCIATAEKWLPIDAWLQIPPRDPNPDSPRVDVPAATRPVSIPAGNPAQETSLREAFAAAGVKRDGAYRFESPARVNLLSSLKTRSW